MPFIIVSMEESSGETGSRSACHEIPGLLWNENVNHSFQKTPLLDQENSMHTFASCSFKIHFNIILSSMDRSIKWTPSFSLSD
jgi:hypothetical protein